MIHIPSMRTYHTLCGAPAHGASFSDVVPTCPDCMALRYHLMWEMELALGAEKTKELEDRVVAAGLRGCREYHEGLDANGQYVGGNRPLPDAPHQTVPACCAKAKS